MAVYVDDMYKLEIGRFGRMKMSHMTADNTEELLAMADKIGVQRKWIQDAGTHLEHFDVSLSARAKAVKAGAVEIGYFELGRNSVNRLSDPKSFYYHKYLKPNQHEKTKKSS